MVENRGCKGRNSYDSVVNAMYFCELAAPFTVPSASG